MGEIIKLRCPGCGYHEQFFVGAGMRDFSSERVLTYFDEAIRGRAEEILHDPKEALLWEYDRALGQCESCRSLRSLPVLLRKDGAETLCGACECGGKMRLWMSELLGREPGDEMPVCPQCGGALDAENAGMWD